MSRTQTRYHRLLVIALASTFLLPSAFAQSPRRLSVSEAIELAGRLSPRLGEIRERAVAKEGEWLTGFGLAAPELSYFREGIGTPGTGFAERRWTISQSIDFPLQSYFRMRRTSAERDALLITLGAEKALLKGEVKKAYTDVLFTQELIHLRTEEVALANQFLEAARLRMEYGEATELEVMKAELEVAQAETALEEAIRDHHATRYLLFNIVGIDPEEQLYEIEFPDTLAFVDAVISQDEVLARLQYQPEIRGAERSLQAATLGVKQTKASLLPALTFDVYFQDYGSGFRQHGFMVGLKLPLWVMPNHRGGMQIARAEVESWRWRRQDVVLGLKKEAELAWHSYQNGKQTIDRFRSDVQGRSSSLLSLTLEGYRAGEIDFLTLLEAQRTFLSGQLRYYSALREYYRQLIDLERFLGRELVFSPAGERTQDPL